MSHLRIFLLLLLSVSSLSQPSPPSAILIDCGASESSVIDGRKWQSDEAFVSSGTPKTVPDKALDQILFTVRSFPLETRRKFCYVVSVSRGWKYMIRTTYFYGGVNGKDTPSPPVFDQIVDGTFWGVVNTTADYADGLASYYEGVFMAQGKSMSFCVGSNSYTTSDPFISALELVRLDGTLYNSTDFSTVGMSLVARHAFGYSGPIIRFPDDEFDRFWEPYSLNSTGPNNRKLEVSGFWNLPPSRIFNTDLRATQVQPLEFTWPPMPLAKATYYIALYFAHDSDSLGDGSRVFDVSVNGITYYKELSVTPAGAVIFASRWPLEGLTTLTLSPRSGSNLAPLINGGEMFELVPLGGKTLVRDVTALNAIKKSFKNAPADWNGDPCFPKNYTWSGVTCSEGPRIRIVTLNLTNMGISGSLAPAVTKLTALSSIWLGKNSLSGSLPDFSSLKLLESLHLEDNRFSGNIPPSLGGVPHLRELFLQNNNLTGQIPSNLLQKPGLNLRTSGNPFLTQQPR
ncbi:PREDICTED: probable LRR receptor-like serine/threonine-protein kinase At1g67720 [Camelina sativa]|uniref:Probable LRR receptor-like serine/threonine-protein kinase At1g67720 n=1 Tax=Camelina sativa TaxID=90675 RepID=A0ABM0W0Z4_CAMSA|nr:PREDICTED: probable LRR receptor-like serine/threonine-protein kinase At1g67720 [Camelina sativa]